MADDREIQQAAMAEQGSGSTPAPESNGETKERKSPIKGAHQRTLDFVATLIKEWQDDTSPAKGSGDDQETHDVRRETALALLGTIAGTITGYRDEEREYGATGKWYGMVRKDGTRTVEQCSATPTAATHPSVARCFGGFAGKIPAEVWTRHGKTLPFMVEVFAAK